MYFYSATTGGLYVQDINSSLPGDAVEVSGEEYLALISAGSQGKVVIPDSSGYPTVSDPKPLPGALARSEREWRDAQLLSTDGIVSRHRDELEEAGPTTLTADRYAALQTYRRALRNWPQDDSFPLVEHRPPAPEWLVELVL